MEVHAAISKIDRHASVLQGNKVEIIERPKGGISIVMAEGKLSGKRSSAVAMKAAHEIINLIMDGIHDGASARAVLSKIKKDYQEKAQVTLSIISCDLESKTVVVTKNNLNPVLISEQNECRYLSIDEDAEQLRCNPAVYQFELARGQLFVLLSEGVLKAGSYNNNPIDFMMTTASLFDENEEDLDVQEIADFLLNQAISHDSGKPRDDMTVVVLQTSPAAQREIRREYVCYPIKQNSKET